MGNMTRFYINDSYVSNDEYDEDLYFYQEVFYDDMCKVLELIEKPISLRDFIIGVGLKVPEDIKSEERLYALYADEVDDMPVWCIRDIEDIMN